MKSHFTGGAAGCSGEIPAVPAEWAGWERVTGNCDWPVYHTADPGLVPALTWSPCEGIEGCVKLETPWYPGSVAPVARHTSYGRGASGEWLVLTQEHPDRRRITAVFALHEGGRVVGALGHVLGDQAGIPNAVRGDTLLMIFGQPVQGDENNVRYDFYYGPIDQPATYRKPAFSGSTADTYGAIQEIALAEGTLGTGYAGRAIGLTDLTTHAVSYITTPTAEWRDKSRVVPHGSALVFLEHDDTGNALWSWRPGGATERVRKAAHGAYVGVCDATGDDLAWLEASEPDGGYFGRHDLWVSPFATSEADLEPRHVSRITGLKTPFTTLKSNDGQVGVITSDELQIYEPTAGVVRALPRPPVTTGCSEGLQCFEDMYTGVLHVDSTEVIAPMGRYSNVRSIVRLQLADLPATPVDSSPPGDGGGADAPGDDAAVD